MTLFGYASFTTKRPIMQRFRALVVGAGRIAAGYNWHDLEYTHAGAYRAFKDRVEVVGFVDPDKDRRDAATRLWGAPSYPDLLSAVCEVKHPEIISVCTQPETQSLVYDRIPLSAARVIWCEKPYWGPRGFRIPTQVNFMRRADLAHRSIATEGVKVLKVIGKLDHHTVPHFEDLARWWKAEKIEYTVSQGPCSYRAVFADGATVDFPNGGVDGGKCFKGMLENILDFLDNGTPLFSPAP